MSRRSRAGKPKALPPARRDHRPLFYDISRGSRVQCFYCVRLGLKGITFDHGEAFMADPANSPDGTGDIHTVCKAHLPNDAVIYSPHTNKCRDKSGQNEWMEDRPKWESETR